MDGISSRILQIRKTMGLSQAAFGKKINLSQNFIWAVENGQRDHNAEIQRIQQFYTNTSE